MRGVPRWVPRALPEGAAVPPSAPAAGRELTADRKADGEAISHSERRRQRRLCITGSQAATAVAARCLVASEASSRQPSLTARPSAAASCDSSRAWGPSVGPKGAARGCGCPTIGTAAGGEPTADSQAEWRGHQPKRSKDGSGAFASRAAKQPRRWQRGAMRASVSEQATAEPNGEAISRSVMRPLTCVGSLGGSQGRCPRVRLSHHRHRRWR